MVRRKKVVETAPSKFFHFPEIEVDGFIIEKGEIIKVKDEWGMKFKFDSLVTNTETGAQWVDCFEVYKQRTGCLRSFKLDRIKRIPKRRGKRRVQRGTTNPTP
jgi:uncharacterized protein YqgV (UPF0045/DUF77 family)